MPDSGSIPPLMALPNVITSGVAPKCSLANHLPVRPKPVMTSSAISSTS